MLFQAKYWSLQLSICKHHDLFFHCCLIVPQPPVTMRGPIFLQIRGNHSTGEITEYRPSEVNVHDQPDYKGLN